MRGSDPFQEVGVRIGAVALVALVAGVVLGWAPLIPAAAALAGGLYAAELAIADAPLDVAVPAVAAAGLLLCTGSATGRSRSGRAGSESAARACGGPRSSRCSVRLHSSCPATLLALVDAVRARGLALDLIGALAAVTVLATVLVDRASVSRATARRAAARTASPVRAGRWPP